MAKQHEFVNSNARFIQGLEGGLQQTGTKEHGWVRLDQLSANIGNKGATGVQTSGQIQKQEPKDKHLEVRMEGKLRELRKEANQRNTNRRGWKWPEGTRI